MKVKLKINRKQQIALIALILTIIISLTGIGYNKREAVQKIVVQDNPGYYQVSSILDGDTIMVKVDGKDDTVRFIGVDTPETHHPKKPVQCFGVAAADFTKSLIGNNLVRLQADPDDDNRDIYGRLLRYVYLPDGTLVNKEIIARGYGFAYTSFPFTKSAEFRQAEATAREQQKGLWQGCQVEDNGSTKNTNNAN